MQVPFNSVFTLIDGRIIPKTHVAIGNVTMAAGTPILPILPIAGTWIGTITDCDLSVEDEDGIIVVVGYYRSGQFQLIDQ
jgi:hypothetical protein